MHGTFSFLFWGSSLFVFLLTIDIEGVPDLFEGLLIELYVELVHRAFHFSDRQCSRLVLIGDFEQLGFLREGMLTNRRVSVWRVFKDGIDIGREFFFFHAKPHRFHPRPTSPHPTTPPPNQTNRRGSITEMSVSRCLRSRVWDDILNQPKVQLPFLSFHYQPPSLKKEQFIPLETNNTPFGSFESVLRRGSLPSPAQSVSSTYSSPGTPSYCPTPSSRLDAVPLYHLLQSIRALPQN